MGLEIEVQDFYLDEIREIVFIVIISSNMKVPVLFVLFYYWWVTSGFLAVHLTGFATRCFTALITRVHSIKATAGVRLFMSTCSSQVLEWLGIVNGTASQISHLPFPIV